MYRARYEFKYIAPHDVAKNFLDRISDVVEPDPNMVGDGYHVNSIYYDTSDFRSYFEKSDGVNPRYKVRVRFYGTELARKDLDRLSVAIEVKYRLDQLIHKKRAWVPGGLLEELSEGQPVGSKLGKATGGDVPAIERILLENSFFPVCLVSYQRCAYVTRINPTLRITIDTNLRASGPYPLMHEGAINGNHFLPSHLCVIEIKFHWAMPLWLLEICQELALRQRRYSKYCSALELLYPQVTDRSVRLQSMPRAL